MHNRMAVLNRRLKDKMGKKTVLLQLHQKEI